MSRVTRVTFLVLLFFVCWIVLLLLELSSIVNYAYAHLLVLMHNAVMYAQIYFFTTINLTLVYLGTRYA